MSPCNDVGGRASSRAANRSIILGLTWRWSGLSWTSITIRRLPDEDAIPPGDGLEVTRTRTTRTKGLVKSPVRFDRTWRLIDSHHLDQAA